MAKRKDSKKEDFQEEVENGLGELNEKNYSIRISQDEFNLAIFPIAVLDKRVQKITSYLTFAENINSNGRDIVRTWTVLAHPIEGLPSTVDEDVYVALMELSHEQGGSKKVFFSRYDLIRRLGWPLNSKHYERLESSLRKLAAVRIEAKNAYVDSQTNMLVDVGMSIIQEFKIFDEAAGKKGEPKSYILWSDRVAQSLNEKLFKKLDAGFYFKLVSPIAKRVFRYLDKKFGSNDYFVIGVKKLAFEHVGMSREITYVSQIMQRLEPGIKELVEKGFLASWELTEETLHFHKNTKFGLRLRQLVLPLGDVDTQIGDMHPEKKIFRDIGIKLERQLVERGMIPTVAHRLMESVMTQGKLEFVESTIAYFDRTYKNRKLNNPGGFLYALILNGPNSTSAKSSESNSQVVKLAQFEEVKEKKEDCYKIPDREIIQKLELGYIDYLEKQGEKLLHELKKSELKERIEEERKMLLSSDKRSVYERWPPEVLKEHLCSLVSRTLALHQSESFSQWCKKQGYLFLEDF